MKKIRVGIADDNELSRQMLRAIAEMDTDLEIVGEAMSGVEALALVKSQKPDVMLLDVVMPLGDGLEVLSQVKEEEDIPTKFIMVSALGILYCQTFPRGSDSARDQAECRRPDAGAKTECLNACLQ